MATPSKEQKIKSDEYNEVTCLTPEAEERLSVHKDITTRALVGSGVFLIVVGKKTEREWSQEAFHVHKHLLILHAGHFRDLLQVHNSELKHLDLPHGSPLVFTMFISWLYTGEVTKSLREQTHLPFYYGKAWVLGEKLKSPSFQNYCMMHILRSRRNGVGRQWPDLVQAKYVYGNTNKGSLLRKLVTDALAYNRLRGGKEWNHAEEQWRELLESTPELSVDFSASPKPDIAPWADNASESYMLMEPCLGTLWKELLDYFSGQRQIASALRVQ